MDDVQESEASKPCSFSITLFTVKILTKLIELQPVLLTDVDLPASVRKMRGSPSPTSDETVLQRPCPSGSHPVRKKRTDCEPEPIA